MLYRQTLTDISERYYGLNLKCPLKEHKPKVCGAVGVTGRWKNLRGKVNWKEARLPGNCLGRGY